MSTGLGAFLCAFCGKPMGESVWISGRGYHPECTRGPDFRYVPQPLTDDDVRRIVREELALKFPLGTK